VLPVIDARRGEVFASLHEGGEQRWAPFAIRPERLVERLRVASCTPLAAGDGSLRFRHILEAAGIAVAPEGSPAHVVRSLHLCRLAEDVQPKPPETVLPAYLRDPDIQPPTG
jgi:tRNA A37 threonylcarbamoyladenosine modification protein TsaB